MARLLKRPPYTGTKDGMCIYFMRGKFFIRGASSLTAERVKKSPAFRETRKYSEIMARASRISSLVYRQITGKHKNHNLYNLITGRAIRMLKEGIGENEVIRTLSELYV